MQVTTGRREKTIAHPQNGIGYGRGMKTVAGSMEHPKITHPVLSDGWMSCYGGTCGCTGVVFRDRIMFGFSSIT